MSAMMDARCEKCGKRFGWSGEVADRPPCPRCGHQIDPAKLAADQAVFDEFRELLLRHPRNANATELRKQRTAAGLTVGQAVAETGIVLARLLDLEQGRKRPTEDEAARLAKAYGVGEG